VYETSTFTLLNKKAIPIEGIADFCWSPTDNVIAFWVPVRGQIPARIGLLDIPGKKEFKSKSLYGVNSIFMTWHPNGDFITFKIDKTVKKKEKQSFEIMRMREKNIPIEVVEFDTKIVDFAWEPKGERFAVIIGDTPKLDIQFYTLAKGQLKLINTLEKRAVDKLYWSPRGQHIVLAGQKHMSGLLEFWDANDMEMLGSGEHFMLTDVQWDPTGRYVSTSTSYYRHQSENGFAIWSFIGVVLHKFKNDKFWQFLWRPRPPSLLTEEDEKVRRLEIHKY
jgi:translation initiation factor 3 subunit B